MDEIEPSKLHFFSYGLAIDDNLDNTSYIKIFPIEKLYTEGDELSKVTKELSTITSKVIEITPEATEAIYSPSEETIEIDRTKYIIAEWCNLTDSNRITPPNTCKGENIIISRYGDSSLFFWDTIRTDLKLRKSEHVIYTYSDKPTLDETEDELKDRYYIEYSPKNKRIRLHTGKKYGEYTDYDLTIKTDDGYIKIIDGKDNMIELNSKTNTLTTRTDYVVVNAKKEMIINTPKLTFNIGKLFTMTVPSLISNIKSTLYNLSSISFKGGNITHDDIPIDKSHVHTGNLGVDTSPPK